MVRPAYVRVPRPPRPSSDDPPTLGDWAQEWLDLSRVVLKPKTVDTYKSILHRTILPEFGHRTLDEITPREVGHWMVALTDRDLGGSQRRQSLSLLSQLLDQARDYGLVATNPCDGVRRPRLPRPTMRYLSAAEVERLASAVPTNYWPLIHVLAYGGFRWGEAIALRPRWCDLPAARAFVAETFVDVNGRVVRGPTKTDQMRFAGLPRFLCQELDECIRLRGRGRDDLIFTAPRGGPLRIANFRNRVWWPALEAAGLPRALRIHDLRHTCASLLIAANAHPVTVQHHLGHALLRTTFDVYGHVFPNNSVDAAETLERIHREASSSEV
jgi:integrase